MENIVVLMIQCILFTILLIMVFLTVYTLIMLLICIIGDTFNWFKSKQDEEL